MIYHACKIDLQEENTAIKVFSSNVTCDLFYGWTDDANQVCRECVPPKIRLRGIFSLSLIVSDILAFLKQ